MYVIVLLFHIYLYFVEFVAKLFSLIPLRKNNRLLLISLLFTQGSVTNKQSQTVYMRFQYMQLHASRSSLLQ